MNQPFNAGQILYLSAVPYAVIQTLNGGKVDMQNKLTGAFESFAAHTLLEEYVAGTLKTQGPDSLCSPISRKKCKPARMDHLSVRSRAETRRRMDYLVRAERANWPDLSSEERTNVLREIAKARNESWPPHESTILRWQREYRRAGEDVRALFCLQSERGGKGASRLHREVEQLLLHEIEKTFERSRSWSAEVIHLALQNAINLRNAERTRDDQLICPSLRTLQRRLARMPAYDVAVAKHGVTEANRRFARLGASRATYRILELVEIDHTPIDILVVNEDGLPIGRPMLTVVLDRYSRCILGFHLSLAGSGTEAVFEAIRHALLPKTYLQLRYADLNLEWPCFGWFNKLLMDNGREFHSGALEDALLNIGIITEYAGSRQPNDKPFVERFQKTLNYSFIHTLPGTTLAKVHHRIGFKSESEAAITLETLDKLIHIWICDVYHRRPHMGLGKRTPLDVWNESARVNTPELKLDADRLDIEFGQRTVCTLQKYGIDLQTFRFHSDRLLQLIKRLPPHSKVEVKWTKSEAGWVHVWDEANREFFKVPNIANEFRGLTMNQAKLAKRVRAEGTSDDSVTRASATAIVNDISDEARQSKKLKHRRAAARLDNKTSKSLRQLEREVPDEDEFIERKFRTQVQNTVPLQISVELPGWEGAHK